MIDSPVIERILTAGVQAPSGDNTQPWSFSVDGSVIIVRHHPEADHPILNVEARGTLIATGALIENMVIAAREEGLEASVHLFEREGEVARLVLSYAGDKGHRLYHTIRERHTHRGHYDTGLEASLVESLAIAEEPHTKLKLITSQKDIRRIADASVAMEESALKTRKLHYHFFRSILWRSTHNDAGVSGLYIKTTELPPPVQALFRLIRHWPIMRILGALGLPALAAKQNANVYASSGAIAVILTDRTEPQDFVAAGRTMQRVWLEATHAGLAAQPLAGLIYLAEYISRTDDNDFDPTLKTKILTARATIRTVCDEGQDTIAMMLRIGVPRNPASARSRRRPPKVI